MKRKKVDWSQAPKELLGLIAERLNSIEDYVRFGAVCKSFRLVILDHRNSNFSPKTLPWLMFPLSMKVDEDVDVDEDEDENGIKNPDFYSVRGNKCYKFYLPEPRSCFFTGSRYGWLILYCEQRVELYNPLAADHIPLPQLFKLKSYVFNIARLFMPCPPYSVPFSVDRYIVVVDSLKDGLFFIRAGDPAWTTIQVADGHVGFTDVLHLNNGFYLVDSRGIIRHFDITSPNPVATQFAKPPKDIRYEEYSFYLVELLGELHLVVKYEAFEDHRTFHFQVYKLDLSTKKWEEVFTLGDYTFFIGRTSSFSIRASDFERCRRGCIYFNDVLDGGWTTTRDIWIFDLESEDMDVLHTGAKDLNLFSCPAWFIPTLL
ncbi:hypothetical protein ACHQM5_013845 [Ranunculus cassubicifolius]